MGMKSMDKLCRLAKEIVYAGADLLRHFNSAVIVAAGNGTRMGSVHKTTKQLADLDGIPVIVRTLLQFDQCPFLNEIIVVARQEEIGCYDGFVKQYGIQKLNKVVAGGETRQKSVMEGLKNVDDRSEFIAIHDGARCLVTPEMIERVFKEAYLHGAATAAELPRDTIKRAASNGYIQETIDRTMLWHAQTPQIFKTDLYRAAAYMAAEEGVAVTDDCMLVERIGVRIKLVDCGHENLKLTTPDDFYLASAILRLRADRLAQQQAEPEAVQ